MIDPANLRHLHHLIDAYRTSMAAGGLSPATIQARLTGVRLLARATDTDPWLVTTEQIQDWLAGDMAAWTRRTYYSHVRAWLSWLNDVGERDDDPLRKVKPPKVPRCVPRPLDQQAVDHLLATASGHLLTFVLLGVYAGLRVHEIAKIRGADVSATGLRVVGKGGVSAVIPTHPAIWEDAQYYPRDLQYWFPSYLAESGHLHPQSVTGTIRRALREMGVEGSAHQLRHRFGTDAYRATDRDLLTTQRLMRHASPSTTAGYALVDDDDMRAAVFKLGRPRTPMPHGAAV